ncbi:MAG: 30S ribosomal protein S2 [Planctomycetes bacterium]|nr:30S ribosomal protein S2 [Planctomycetota bacterium]
MADFSWRDLVAAGVHFGHRTSRWDPRMKPYIFGRRSQIHIIDLKETVKGLLRAQRFLASAARRGDDVLFVGTKRQALQTVQEQAQRCGMPYVSERWLGGTLTNFRTVLSRLGRLEELERMESDGSWERMAKKEVSSLRRELRKVRRNLGGLRTMKAVPGALLMVDPRQERIAVREAVKLGIPIVALADTDGNPEPLDIVIPGNDDALRSVGLIVRLLADAVAEGVAGRGAPVERASRTAPARARSRPAAREPSASAQPPTEASPEAPPAEATGEQAESATA